MLNELALGCRLNKKDRSMSVYDFHLDNSVIRITLHDYHILKDIRHCLCIKIRHINHKEPVDIRWSLGDTVKKIIYIIYRNHQGRPIASCTSHAMLVPVLETKFVVQYVS